MILMKYKRLLNGLRIIHLTQKPLLTPKLATVSCFDFGVELPPICQQDRVPTLQFPTTVS